MPKQKKAKAPRGQAGLKTFEAVEKLVAGGAMTRTAAFAKVAKDTRRSAGTVSVTYYKIRNRQKHAADNTAPENGSRPKRKNSTVYNLLRQLGDAFEGQQQEITRLRGELRILGQLKQLLQ